MQPFVFKNPLVEGVIEQRKTQFTMQIKYNGEVITATVLQPEESEI